jgi:hypothetical protein
MGQPLRPLFRLKVEVEARPSAGTAPTAGRLERATENTLSQQKNQRVRPVLGVKPVLAAGLGKIGPVVGVTRGAPR